MGSKIFRARRAPACQRAMQQQSLRTPWAHVVTDPPYVGNVNYAELADFFYVWLRLALKDNYAHFAPEYTPKVEEIVEN